MMWAPRSMLVEMVAQVEIASELQARIVAEARARPSVEVCGLLLGTGTRVDAIEPCRNVATDPARRFEIDPVALLAAHRRARAGGPAVVGHYHSHPGGTAFPSPRDAAAAADDGAIWVIAAGDGLSAWRAVVGGSLHDRFAPLSLSPACRLPAQRPDTGPTIRGFP